MIAPTAARRKGPFRTGEESHAAKCPGNAQELREKRSVQRETHRHGIVSGIIIPPNFRQPTAPLACENIILRWPGPFGTGFLSPQPPGVVGIGPVRRIVYPHTGPTRVGPFSFWGDANSPLRRRRKRLNHLGPARASHAGITNTDQDRFENFSAGAYRPRRASGRACRDCRPGHTPPRHRRRRARCFPAGRSSCRDCRSSRRP